MRDQCNQRFISFVSIHVTDMMQMIIFFNALSCYIVSRATLSKVFEHCRKSCFFAIFSPDMTNFRARKLNKNIQFVVSLFKRFRVIIKDIAMQKRLYETFQSCHSLSVQSSTGILRFIAQGFTNSNPTNEQSSQLTTYH